MKDFENEFDERVLERRFKDARDRRTFQKVFDSSTLKAVHALAVKGLFDVLEHIVSTGKEAHVFVASDISGNTRAVKIYKTSTSDFKNMRKYIEGDKRFGNLRKDKRQVVFTWTRKEFKNLLLAAKAGLSVPLPLGFKENVLVMEFIGEGESASPQLRELKPSMEELGDFYAQFVEFMANLYIIGLVHADLSEYNTLVRNGKLVFIDMGQAVLLDHPKAREFFERDVRNTALYFSKKGLEKGFEGVYNDVKNRKEALEKK
ncbi:MAG TPA: serine protein kinase RIO [archaeon]|nr:serine protein kinase RIO [archaeon]